MDEGFRDRDVSMHYPPTVEGRPSLLRLVHKPTGYSVEGLVDDRDVLLKQLRDDVEAAWEAAGKASNPRLVS